MSMNKNDLAQSVVQFLCISGLILAMAFLVYQRNIFIPTRWPFQFVVSGITIGLAYTAFKKRRVLTGLLALLLWYIVVTCVICNGLHNSWLFILNGAYIGLIAVAVYVYLRIIQRPFASDKVIQIIISSVLMGIMNGFVVFVLRLHARAFSTGHSAFVIMQNIRIGIGLGFLFGIGILFSDHLIKSSSIQTKNNR
ncbi:MAG TPA: hypothetical protein VLX68_08825 [Chitinivibrionales bacterium]|nr:hypothetical protein [Chitinivibrionales bacterium]